jgi:hypothetical protein
MMTLRMLFVSLTLLAAVDAAAQPLTFSRTDSPAVAGARGVVAADFNGDGWVDVATANAGRDTIAVLLNTRDETFTLAWEKYVDGGPFEITAGDLDRDGTPDLVVANADKSTIEVLLLARNGSLKTHWSYSAASNPRAVALADVNRDGILDLIYTAFYQNAITILNGVGNGAFEARVPAVLTGVRPQGIATGDFNNDGKVDLAVANTGSSPMTVAYGDGTGRFTRQDVAGPQQLNVVSAADFNGDGWLDLAAASTPNDLVAVFRGSASGFAYSAALNTGASPRGLTAADVNQDGWPDIAVANRDASTVTAFVNRQDGQFTNGEELAGGSGARAVAAADFNNDGRLDLVSGNEFSPSVTFYFNDTAFARAAFTLKPQELSLGFSHYGDRTVAAADFNHNGIPDVIAGKALVLDRQREVLLPVTNPPNDIAVGDLNRDGHPDLVVHESHIVTSAHSFQGLILLLGDGRGGFTKAAEWDGYWGIPTLAVTDVNRDGRHDIVARLWDYSASHYVVWEFLNQGNMTFATRRFDLGNWESGWRLVDVDHDAKLDFVISSYDGNFRIHRGDGSGGFGAPQVIPSGAKTIYSVTVGDLNHDGLEDLAFTSGDAPGLYVMLQSAGGWEAATHYSATMRRGGEDWVGQTEILDFDRDGHADVLSGSGKLYRGNGDGTLKPVDEFAFYAEQFAFVDWNRDGLVDIVSGEYEGPRMLLNQRGETNRPPVAVLHHYPQPDTRTVAWTWRYDWQFFEDATELWAGYSTDPDLHALEYEWRKGDGTTMGFGDFIYLPPQMPGTYSYELIVRDLRGGEARLPFTVTIAPAPEIVLYAAYDTWETVGDWQYVEDASAAGGYRVWEPNKGAPKVAAPATAPANYFDIGFVPQPGLEYKLWVRLKADGNSWANDSVWLQFGEAYDATGNKVYQTGTTSGLAINLEECSGCGVSGWGWEDDGWGAVNRNGVTLKFQRMGWHTIRIQTREDGVSIDQVVLSAEKYKTARPGAAKNDTTIVGSSGS